MTTFIKAGLRETGQRGKLIWTWYAISLVCSIVIAAPLVIAIGALLGSTLEGKRLFDNFDASWITEVGYSSQWQQLTVWAPLAASIAALYVLLNMWLSGGLLSTLENPDNRFFAGCARWWAPFLRLFLWTFILWGIAFAVRGVIASMLAKLAEDSMSGKPAAYGSMANFVVTCLLFSLVNMIGDYAKIYMVARNERKARRGLIAGLRFVFLNFRRSAGLYLTLSVFLMFMLAVYHVWSEVIGQASMSAVLCLFITRQAYMFGRTWLRMVFLASEYAYFVSSLPKAVPPPAIPQPTPQHILESFEFNESH